uniref:Ephrin_rec_like domain-containing protein n=1 Tax=Mesocestoides corti TaxID=53468 RepID=A0A5K3FNR3_MESCO
MNASGQLLLLLLIYALPWTCGVEFPKESQLVIWLPSGRLVQLPCNIDGKKFTHLSTNALNTSAIEIIKAKLLAVVELEAVTIWFNTIGQVIHVGAVLPIHLPMTAPGEIEHELSRTASVYEHQTARPTLEIPQAYAVEVGSSLAVLHQRTMTTVTCRTYKPKNAGLLRSDPPTTKQFSLKEEIIYNQYSLLHYTQPHVTWKYVIPEEFENVLTPNRHIPLDWWRNEAETFCKGLRNVKEYQTSPCVSVSLNRIPTRAPTRHTSILTLTISLSTNPMNLLSNPTTRSKGGNITLAYIHASMKHMLDVRLVNRVATVLTQQGEAKPYTILIDTSVEVICPPGTHLKYPPIPLIPIKVNFGPDTRELRDTKPIVITANDSAYSLVGFSTSCDACPPGHAPRAPYSFSPCAPCPRGFFRGQTGWPASAGCVACPAGFTTVSEGSTSVEDCVVDGGTLTRTFLGLSVWAYQNLMDLFIASHEFSSSYTKRSKFRLGEKGEPEVSETPVHWTNRIKTTALAFGVSYSVIWLILLTLAVYRLILICHFKRVHEKHVYLLRKGIIIGQLNAQDDARDLLRQDFAKN